MDYTDMQQTRHHTPACRSAWRLAWLMLALIVSAAAQAAGPAEADSTRQEAEPRSQAADTMKFSVAGFKLLPNDVSAFITPVRDLNNDACALIKAVAPPEFAFSSPLGIVKRINKVGEIWLYLPRNTKLLTIKHPQWGVIRNYRLPQPLESHMTYELRMALPQLPVIQRHDTIVFTQTITDTVVVKRRKPRLPWRMHALLTASFHEYGPSWGILLAAYRRHGFFVHAQSDFQKAGTQTQHCDREGFLPDSDIKPYYTGKTRDSNFAVTAGLAHRLCRWLSLFYGAGYGRSSVTWQLAEIEGGGLVLNDGLSCKGVAGEAGLLCSYRRYSLSVSALTVANRQWQVGIGLGIRIGKREK